MSEGGVMWEDDRVYVEYIKQCHLWSHFVMHMIHINVYITHLLNTLQLFMN